MWECNQHICWHCANAYAHKCKKFHTDKPLSIWEEYKEFKKERDKSSSYIVKKCLKYVYDGSTK